MNHLDDNINYSDLVRKAQLGCQESMDSLAQQAHGRVFAYIYRLTLNRDVTEDLQQETMLMMVGSLGKLRNPECFWAWVYRTALSKVQHHFRSCQRERQKMSAFDEKYLLERGSGNGGGLKSLIDKELSQAILDAMVKLKLRHRNVLVLRCYEQLRYSEIAEIMDCSRMNAQVLFFRAKRSLKRKMSKDGFGKGMLLTALGLFGQMTAPADAAPITVSASTVKVGATAAVIGAAGGKLGLTIVAMAAAAVVTVGSVSLLNNGNDVAGFGGGLPGRAEVKSFHFVKQAWDKSGSPNPNLARGRSLSKGAYEQWFYFPEGIDGPLFMMMQRWDPQQESKLCSWLQNGKANHYYHCGEETIYLYNYHLPMRYMTTRRLPCDTEELTEFLDDIEGETVGVDYVRDSKTGLLVGALDDRFYNAQNFEASYSYNTLDEKSFDSFVYPWPESAAVVDERDLMHQRGWTYFRVTGEINGEQIRGTGRIPFVYDAYKQHPPWLRLNIGDEMEIVDDFSKAYLADSRGEVFAAYPAGSFFTGLARPWMGMHTVDMIRRDAAEKKVRFSIKNYGGGNEHYGKAEIILFGQVEQGQIQIVYTVDIDRDVVEKVEFFVAGDSEGDRRGVLEFTYLDQLDDLDDEFVEPAKRSVSKKTHRESMGMLWLMELMQGTLGR